MYAEKLNLSTCPECSEFCISKSKTIFCKVESKSKATQVIQDTQEPFITATLTVNSDDTTSKKSTLSSSSSSITITRSKKSKNLSLFKNDGKNK